MKTIGFLFLLLSGNLLSMNGSIPNCTVPYISNISNAWNVGIAITQTGLAIFQVVASGVTFLSDGYFYYKTAPQEVLDLEGELMAQRDENHRLKQNESMLVLCILDAVKERVTEGNDSREFQNTLLLISKNLHLLAERQ